MAAFMPYRYRPLPSPRHIRLLELSIGFDQDASLAGTLRVMDLDTDDPIPYVALSYTWGQPNFTEALVVDGTRVLNITPNLAAALRRFRYASALKWIWVDAICINQEDDDEKGIQIPLMADIYRDASRVMVWLGDRIEDAELLQNIKRLKKGGKALPTLPNEQSNDSTAIETNPLSRLGELQYFTRRWIVQEIALNPNVVLCCRNIELPLPQLAGFTDARCMDSGAQNVRLLYELWLDMAMCHPRKPLSKRPEVMRYGPDLLGNRDIASLMDQYSHYDCADGRDRISALLGLSTDAFFDFKVEYRDSVDHIFLEFAEFLANRGHMAWLLHQTLQRKEKAETTTLPSWVPDWRIAAPEHNSLPRRGVDVVYVKRPCSIRASSIPGVHMLTATFWHSLPAKECPHASICLDIVWKSAIFSQETRMDERISSVLVELWPFISMRLGGIARSYRNLLWHGLLAEVAMAFQSERVQNRADEPLDNIPNLDEEERLDFQKVRNYVKSWLEGIFTAHPHLPKPSPINCVVFCQAFDGWEFGDACGVGGLSSTQSRAVEVGQKVLLAELGWFYDPSADPPAFRHIVRELPMPSGLYATDSSKGISKLASHDSPSGLSGLASIPPFVYEFVGACVPFNFFRLSDWDLDNDGFPFSRERAPFLKSVYTAGFSTNWYKAAYEDTLSIWIK